MKKTSLFILLILLMGTANLFAQISEGGTPLSFKSRYIKSKVPVYNMPSFNLEAMLKEDQYNIENKIPVPYRYAKGFDVDFNMHNSGVWDTLPGGHKVWRITINSNGAYSLDFVLSPYKLPKGAKVFIYNSDKTEVMGAFTYKNNKEYNSLATAAIAGNKITIEYIEPADVEFPGELGISKVYHGYRDIVNWLKFKDSSFGASGSCNIDINCPTGDLWQTEKLAVCRIQLGGGLCTGTLLNNTANDGTPYFLTANHCTGSAYSGWVFNFNYEVAVCGSTTDPYPNVSSISLSGCNLRATSTNLDFCLVEMSSNPPASFNPYLAGWNRSSVPATNTVGIHHPSGDVKKICVDNDPPTVGSFTGYDPNTHWHIGVWEEGVTEPGSSGSALFDENHRVIGDLTGGQAACGNVINDYYQMFSHSWSDYAPTDQQLKFWLDPNNTGDSIINGLDPYNTGVIADFSGTPTTVPLGQTVDFTDLSTPTGTITSWNWSFPGAATTTSTLQNPTAIQYTTLGFHDVTLIVSDGTTTDTLTKVDYIYVEDTVVNADFVADVFTVNVGGNVTFTDLSSPSSSINSWSWDFGDPAAAPSQTANTQGPQVITYNTPGLHTVSLTVSDGVNNDTETKLQYIEVIDPNAINADFVANITTIVAGGTVDFTDLTTNGPATSWNWDFGNGAISNAQNPAGIQYTTPGTYTVTLTVSDGTATSTEIKQDYITVLDSSSLPQADFIANFTTVFVGGTVDFTDLTTNSPTSWNWTFNGGTPATDNVQNPTGITYNTVGDYDVTLAVANLIGNDTVTKTMYIHVIDSTYISDTLVADFQATTSRLIVQGGFVSFEDLTQGYPTNWEWIFPGGTPATTNVQHPTDIQYALAGQYDVTLIVTNGMATDTFTKANYIVVTDGVWQDPNGFCDTVKNTYSSEFQLSFMHLTPEKWGYFPGHNGYTIKAYADKYTNYMFSVIRGLMVPVVKAYQAAGSNSKVRFTVWDVDSITGMPGIALGQKDIPVGAFTPYIYHYVEFDTPVDVNGEFYVGFELFYSSTAQDTFAVYMAPDRGNSNLNTLYVKKGTWQLPGDVLPDSLSTSMAIEIIGCLVTIEEIEELGTILIYPNPSQNMVNIDMTDINAENVEFSFYDIMGRNIIIEKNNTGNNIYQFDFAGQPKGIYFVNMNIDGRNITKKISIIR